MTTPRLTKRRTSLEKHKDEVIALLLTGYKPVQITEKYQVSKNALMKFQQRHADRLAALHAEVERQTTDYAIALKVNRIAALDDRWQRMRHLIEARATDTRYSDEPGYETGLMVHQLKAVGRGDDFQLVDLYVTDNGLLAEMRATERAAAEELAQIQGLPKDGINIEKAIINIHRGVPELGV